jgi:hypothetical protein
MKIRKGLTVRQIQERADKLRGADKKSQPFITVRPDEPMSQDRREAIESLRKRCPYLFRARKP